MVRLFAQRPRRRGRRLLSVEILEGRALPSFLAPLSFDAGIGPGIVAVGDVNSDGRPDLAVPNIGFFPLPVGDTVSVFLGNGDGTFQAARNFPAGSRPIAVALADVNGDGRPDLTSANFGSDNVSVLLGNGDGTFQTAQNFPAGSYPSLVAVADVNGDGRLDLAVANSNSDNVSVLLGNGNGTFQTARNFPAGDRPLSVAVADVNGDGRPDLAVANYYSNNVSVLLGNGDGSFQAAQNFPVGSHPVFGAVADVNGDGRPDLAVANHTSNSVSVLLGNGDGSFQTAQNFSAGTGSYSVAVADVNSDGRPDLAVANFNGDDVSVLLGNGNGTFQTAQSFPAGSEPVFVAAADINGDGRLDLAAANFNSANVSVLLGNGNGTFQTPQNPSAGSNPYSVTTADFNGDGRPDLAVANRRTSGTVSVLLGNGNGTFQAARTFPAGNETISVAVADFNGDGRPDLAAANLTGNNVSVLLGNGDGTFQAAQNSPAGRGPWPVAVADVNGDGRPDLAVVNRIANSTVSVMLGNGNGTFQPPQSFPVGSAFSLAVADVNGDGRPDLTVASDTSDNVSVLLGNGDGTFQAAQNLLAGSDPFSVAVADINGDGRPDLAVANFGSDNVSVLLGNGNGTFQAAQNFPAGRNPRALVLADVNGDGRPDLAVASGTVRVLLGNGDGTFQTTPVSYVAGGNPRSIAVADFNGDGRPDLAAANTLVLNSDIVSVLLNVPDPPPTLRVIALTPTRSGFIARFNRPLDSVPLNLYDAAGALGPADVILTGAATGSVAGSLLLHPDRTGFTFLGTGGVLSVDAYTLTLRSAANGFHDTLGALLDGNADGTPGDDFTATFPVSGPAPVVVSIPDFMRGPGQPVNVPADGSGLPLRLSEASGVRAVSLTLRYNPALLCLTGAATALAGASVTLDTSMPGQAVLLFTSPTPLAAGPAVFATLTASVPDTALYGSKQALDLGAVQVGTAAGALLSGDDDGVQVVGYLGDATGNGSSSAADATRILRVAVGLDSGFARYPLADPVIVADVNGNGRIDSTDATHVLQEAVGLDRPEIPPLPPNPPTIPVSGPDPLLFIPSPLPLSPAAGERGRGEGMRGRPGETLTVPVLLDRPAGLDSADLALSYDVRRLELLAVQRGSLTTDFDLFVVNADATAGTVRVGLGRSAGAIEDDGPGSVLLLTFRIKDDAPAGRAIVNLRHGLEQTLTQLNEGGLDLNPDPRDRAGDGLDGIVTILPVRRRSTAFLRGVDEFFRQTADLTGLLAELARLTAKGRRTPAPER